MNAIFPAPDLRAVFVQPWSGDPSLSAWIIAMGFLVTCACGLVGNYLLLRRMALVGDAISHSVLLGIVVAFLVFRSAGTPAMFLGAVASGLLTVAMIEFIHRHSRIKPDAAICIAFTVLFAAGVALLSVLEGGGSIHLDAECVLYGDLALVAFEPPARLGELVLGPPSVIRMGAVLAAVAVAIGIFYKELLITSFDHALARSLGFRTALWHYGLMAVLSLVIVSAFEAVGAILAVAMLIVPPMFAAQLSAHLPTRLLLTILHAAIAAPAGYHLSVWLNCSPAGAMVVASAGLFLIVWVAGLLARWRQRADRPPADLEKSPSKSAARLL